MKVQTLLNSRILSFHKVVLKNRNKVCFCLFTSFFTGNSSALLLHQAPPTAGGTLLICTLLLWQALLWAHLHGCLFPWMITLLSVFIYLTWYVLQHQMRKKLCPDEVTRTKTSHTRADVRTPFLPRAPCVGAFTLLLEPSCKESYSSLYFVDLSPATAKVISQHTWCWNRRWRRQIKANTHL